MLLYLIVVLFPLVIGSMYEKKVATNIMEKNLNKRQLSQRRTYLIFAAIPMFALIAFRHGYIGADAGVYQRMFKEMANTPWDSGWNSYGFEKGFIAFEKVIGIFTSSPLIYQIIYASIYMLSVVGFANRLEKGNFLFLYFYGTLGLYTFMFTGLRQCLAICVCLHSYKYIKHRKLIRFLVCILLAFTFHKSAVLFLAAYVIFRNKLKPFYILMYCALCAFGYYYFEEIQGWFNEQLDYSYEVEETGSGFVFLLVMIIITVFATYTITLSGNMTKEARGIINISFIAFAFWVLRLVSRTAERPSYYFLFFTAAMLGYSIDCIDDGKQKESMTIVIVLLTLALFAYRMYANFNLMIPYRIYS